MPPPAPDRRRRAVLLALLLLATFLVTLPGPLAHAGPLAAPPPAPASAPGPASAPASGGVGAGPGRAWPVGGPGAVLSRFHAPATTWAAGHRGVDLAASPEAEILAAAPGVVTFSGMVAGRPVVTVSHPGSGSPPLRTTYLPVTGTAAVGSAVSAGQPIGRIAPGSGHCAAGCLHWGLLRGDRYLDPLALFGGGAARLLPLGSGS